MTADMQSQQSWAGWLLTAFLRAHTWQGKWAPVGVQAGRRARGGPGTWSRLTSSKASVGASAPQCNQPPFRGLAGPLGLSPHPGSRVGPGAGLWDSGPVHSGPSSPFCLFLNPLLPTKGPSQKET